MKYFLLFFVLLSWCPAIIYGQNNDDKNEEEFKNTQARLNLSPAMELDLDPKNDISFNFLTADDIEYGVTKSQFARFRIKATRPWKLNIKTLTPYFIASGPYASHDMPPSVIGIKKSNSADYTPLSSSDIPLFSGSRGGNFTPGNDFKADIKFTPGFDYGAGYYSIVLLYTLTAL